MVLGNPHALEVIIMDQFCYMVGCFTIVMGILWVFSKVIEKLEYWMDWTDWGKKYLNPALKLIAGSFIWGCVGYGILCNLFK